MPPWACGHILPWLWGLVTAQDPPALRAQVRFGMTPEWVLFHPTLSVYAKTLYGVLDRHVDAHGACFPGRARLARLANMSERQVDKAVRELEDAQALQTRARWVDAEGAVYYERGLGRSQTSTEYTLIALVRPPHVVRDPPHTVLPSPHAQAPHTVLPNESPTTTNEKHTPVTGSRTRPGYTEDFEAFWRSYPKRQAKPQAFEAYKRARRGIDHATVMRALARHQFSTEDRFVPYPQKWLSQAHWLNETGNPPVQATDPDGPPRRLTQEEMMDGSKQARYLEQLAAWKARQGGAS